MSFVKDTKNGITIMRVNQERFDSNIAPEFKAEILYIVEQDVKDVIVDLTNVLYVDSSGLGSLLFGLRQLRDSKGRLKILGAKKRVKSLIRIAKLEEILENFEDEESAFKSFKQ